MRGLILSKSIYRGREKNFVKGAVATIDKCRPVMLIEVANKEIVSFVDFLECETGLSYEVFLAGEDGPLARGSL